MCRQCATTLARANIEMGRTGPCAHTHDGQITQRRRLFDEQRGTTFLSAHARGASFIVLTAVYTRAQSAGTDQFDPMAAIFSVQQNTARELADAIFQEAVPQWAPASSHVGLNDVTQCTDMIGLIIKALLPSVDIHHSVKKMSPGHKQLYSVIIRGCQPRHVD
mmetsp:Transcript_93940/g.137185  ORF Transcript_93940/g.137185 Transcript_93940/m.137185 type:complete len:163 (+) Transcript_93940:403-891(+)